jgi:hypothetical protein
MGRGRIDSVKGGVTFNLENKERGLKFYVKRESGLNV